MVPFVNQTGRDDVLPRESAILVVLALTGWLPRDTSEKPRVCPKCKSPNWDRLKLYERKTVEK